MGKNLSNKYGQKLLDSTKNSTADAIKTESKGAIQKTAEITGDLIANKTADKILSVSTKIDNTNDETNIQKKRYISLEEHQQIIDESRLI